MVLIHEILDSTRTWEKLRGNDVDSIFDSIHTGFTKQLAAMETTIVLRNAVGEQQWVNIKNTLKTQLDDLSNEAKEYLSSLASYPNDTDLNYKIQKCQALENQLREMFNTLP